MLISAPHARAKSPMSTQGRAGLRASDALVLVRGPFLEPDRPTLRVRRGKENQARVAPLRPELQTAPIATTSYRAVVVRILNCFPFTVG